MSDIPQPRRVIGIVGPPLWASQLTHLRLTDAATLHRDGHQYSAVASVTYVLLLQMWRYIHFETGSPNRCWRWRGEFSEGEFPAPVLTTPAATFPARIAVFEALCGSGVDLRRHGGCLAAGPPISVSSCGKDRCVMPLHTLIIDRGGHIVANGGDYVGLFEPSGQPPSPAAPAFAFPSPDEPAHDN